MTRLHAVVPAGIDDAARPSGGNAYDRRVLDGLRAAGWVVDEHPVPGTWPHPHASALADLSAVVAGIATGSVLLVDGLIASSSADVLVEESARVRLVILVHMPLVTTDATAGPGEGGVLRAARAVVATSEWTRRLLVDAYALGEDSVHVAHPGVDDAPLAPGTSTGGSLLCVAAVSPHKGQADLADALGRVADLPWRCSLAGSLDVAPEYVGAVRRTLATAGVADRVTLVGPLGADALERAYAAADLVVVPSRAETYGMVVTEALARGLPVVATRVGGVPEAMGASEPDLPGLLVAPDGVDPLAAALRAWLVDADLRSRLRAHAIRRRATLRPWSSTVADVARVLEGVGRD
ncbi:glycosyltransferase family 4 protein [Terrabacter sp. 2RAF25]|uniref:glycosyltransferase family 4 protein n=1 Tax=Terrabacter sp. 2RAF25 TaxID=3232998 RepID=UPI003F9AC8E3